MYSRSLFVFRQDLRVQDNTALYKATQISKEIIPVFVLDEDILSRSPSDDARLDFLIQALEHLEKELQKCGSYLYVVRGKAPEQIPELIKKFQCQAYFTNKSYGPGSLTRDRFLRNWCIQSDIRYHDFTDFLLFNPERIPTRKVFTPFYKLRSRQLQSDYPELMEGTYCSKNITKIVSPQIRIPNNQKIYKQVKRGSNKYRPIEQVRQRIKNFNPKTYADTRNQLDADGTSKISPYLRFGLISIRQLIQETHKNTIQEGNPYLSELARREFRYHIMHYFPETATVEFQEKRRHIQRSQDHNLLQTRSEGKTGYPIVDAAMRQLRTENRMHGRARMIVASFLTKDMLIDRRLGEQEFAKYLVDYDHAVNIGNRQRSASVGADPKPLRIFNPILQSKKFDPEAQYIKKYIPELKDQDIQAIHDPLSYKLKRYKPIVNHHTVRPKVLEEYSRNISQ